MRSVNRSSALFIAAAAILGACSSSGGSSVSTDAVTESTSRARNTLVSFGADGSGVAKNLVAPLKLSLVGNPADQVQRDGSTLLGVLQASLDSTGLKFSIVLQRLIGATGAVDPTFGTDGRVDITPTDLNEANFTITQNGHVLTTASIRGQTGQIIRRYIAETGELDTSFGDAGQVTVNNLPDGINRFEAISEDNNGNYLVLARVRNEITNTWDYSLTRFTPTGDLDKFGESDGSTVFGFEPQVEENLYQEQRDCKIIVNANDKIDVLCSVDEHQQVSEPTSSLLVRRGLQRVGFEANGTRSIIAAESRANAVYWLDAARSATALDYLRIVDIDPQTDDTLSVVLEGLNRSQATHVFLTREMTNTNVEENGDNILLPNSIDDGSRTGNLQFIRQVRFIASAKPAFAGVYVDAERDEQGIVVSSFKTKALLNRLPLAKYPLVFHRPSPVHLDASGQPNFSFDGLGVDLFGNRNFEITNVKKNSGLMALNLNGEARPDYGKGAGFMSSPISNVGEVPANEPSFPFEGALIAGNNSDFYALGGVWGDVSALAVKHFDGDGKQIGDVVVTSGLNFNPPFPLSSGKAVIDANNNIYVAGFASMPGALPDSVVMGPGIAKFSLETGAVDTTFGENGFAFLQRIDPKSTEPIEPEEWTNIALILQADGSVDTLNVSLERNEDDKIPLEMKFKSLRISPTGNVGKLRQFAIAPSAEIARILPDNLISAIYGATIDAQGRLLVSNIDFVTEMVVDENDPTSSTTTEVAVMKVMRYNDDGSIDTTFGEDGVGGFKIEDVMFGEPLFFSQVRVQPDGRVLVGFTGLDMSFANGLTLGGETHYLVRLTTNGKLDEVPPLDISPEAKAARDALPGVGVEQLPVVQPEVPAAIATSGNAQLADSYEGTQISRTGRLAITTLGISADRAVAVKWAVPESLSERKVKYSVTASPSKRTCSTATTTCVFKNLNPWTTYTFTVKVVSVSAVGAFSSAKSAPVKPIRVVLRGSTTPTTKLITPASKGAQSWKVGGGCTLSKDKQTFTASLDGGICSLSLTTAKSGKTPKTTRSISVFVKVVAP